jgi:hypothetical protein
MITKQEFDSLYSNAITKQEYDKIINKIDYRFDEIVLLINPDIKERGRWFVYGNCDYDSENDCGYFNIQDFKNEINIGGECSFPEPYSFTHNGQGYIPTRWLWTNNDEILLEFNSEVEKAKLDKINQKERLKKQREILKEKKQQMKAVILSKLTKEELKYIKFK